MYNSYILYMDYVVVQSSLALYSSNELIAMLLVLTFPQYVFQQFMFDYNFLVSL